MKTISQQIEGVERHIQKCEMRLNSIERSLRLNTLTESDRVQLENEEKTLEKQLSKHKQDLRGLRKENFKTMIVSTALLLGAFGLYWIFTGT